MTCLVDAEWAQIAPDKVVVATAQQVWMHIIEPTDNSVQHDRFAQPMVGPGTVATTQRLLDGAMAAAKMAISSESKSPELTFNRWLWRLSSAYHTCRFTLPLMEEASERFAASGRWQLAKWAAQKAQEEKGHDQLALLDIQSMGYKAEDVVKVLVSPAAMACVERFISSVRDSDPIDCLGDCYARERLSLRVGEENIRRVEGLLPPGTNATRCLRVHSSVGSDGEHVKETVEMVAGLPASERIAVAQGCYKTGLLFFTPPEEGYISEEELEQLLKPLKK